MKSYSLKFAAIAASVALFALPGALRAATGELTKSGSTWTGKVDGVTVYTGSDLPAGFRVCNEKMNPLGGGTINLRASETISDHLGLWAGTKVNGNGYTVTSNASGGAVACRAGANVGASNITIAGGTPFGMYFRSCTGQTFSGISGRGGITMRIDNCAGGAGTNFSAGSPNCTASSNHGVETYGINGVTFGTITATDRSGGCGLMLNRGQTSSGSNVNGTRCNYGAGYAAFRAGTSIGATIGTVRAVSCGRGIFTLVNAGDITVNTLNADDCSGIGVWLESSYNTKIQSGYVKNCSSCWSISGSSPGSSVTVNCL